jgi:hypothetical protein
MVTRPKVSAPRVRKTSPVTNAAPAAKVLLSIIKPALSMLVFLLVSAWAQQLIETKGSLPCRDTGTKLSSAVHPLSHTAILGVQSYADLENKEVMVGARTLRITRHAAERMIQRGVTTAAVQEAVLSGKLFAYLHDGMVKIGYYDEAKRIFLSVTASTTKSLPPFGDLRQLMLPG